MKQYKLIKINVPAEINPFEVMQCLSHEEAIDFICNVDLSYADGGFTEELIIRLVKSLKGDLVESEKKELINKIHNILKND
jgi:hemerythrin superfamily protein